MRIDTVAEVVLPRQRRVTKPATTTAASAIAKRSWVGTSIAAEQRMPAADTEAAVPGIARKRHGAVLADADERRGANQPDEERPRVPDDQPDQQRDGDRRGGKPSAQHAGVRARPAPGAAEPPLASLEMRDGVEELALRKSGQSVSVT